MNITLNRLLENLRKGYISRMKFSLFQQMINMYESLYCILSDRFLKAQMYPHSRVHISRERGEKWVSTRKNLHLMHCDFCYPALRVCEKERKVIFDLCQWHSDVSRSGFDLF